MCVEKDLGSGKRFKKMTSKALSIILCAGCVLFVVVNYRAVKELVLSQNGGYSHWSKWSQCTKSCGGGRRGKWDSYRLAACKSAHENLRAFQHGRQLEMIEKFLNKHG